MVKYYAQHLSKTRLVIGLIYILFVMIFPIMLLREVVLNYSHAGLIIFLISLSLVIILIYYLPNRKFIRIENNSVMVNFKNVFKNPINTYFPIGFGSTIGCYFSTDNIKSVAKLNKDNIYLQKDIKWKIIQPEYQYTTIPEKTIVIEFKKPLKYYLRFYKRIDEKNEIKKLYLGVERPDELIQEIESLSINKEN